MLVVEREEQAGGIPRHSVHTGFGLRDLHRLLTGPHYAARYVAPGRRRRRRAAHRDDGHRLDRPDGGVGHQRRPASTRSTRARSCSPPAAASGRARRAWCPGTRPLGVFTTGALQQLVYLQRAAGRAPRRRRRRRARQLLRRPHPRPRRRRRPSPWSPSTPRHQTYAPFKWLTATRLRRADPHLRRA